MNTSYTLSASVEGKYYTFSVEGIGSVSGFATNPIESGYSGVFSAFARASFDDFKATPSLTLDVVDSAIQKVSSERAKIGAYINGLEHSIKNLSYQHENMSASLSRIMDTDMAKETMKMTKNMILVQTSQAMLAQANQAPSSILSLLKSF